MEKQTKTELHWKTHTLIGLNMARSINFKGNASIAEQESNSYELAKLMHIIWADVYNNDLIIQPEAPS